MTDMPETIWFMEAKGFSTPYITEPEGNSTRYIRADKLEELKRPYNRSADDFVQGQDLGWNNAINHILGDKK